MTYSVERLPGSSSNAEKQQTKTVSTATYCAEDPTLGQMMRLQETSLAFWDEPAEDVYTLDDVGNLEIEE